MLSHLHADRTRIADLNSQVMQLERAISVLRIQRGFIQDRLDSYKYPVSTLPNEIVSEIFLHFLPVYPECPPLTGILSPTNLTHICQKWREAALATALRVQRLLVQERLESYKYPVLTLPNEIVSEIFVHFLPIYPECPPLTGILSPTNLTHICRDWREVALATPTLWRAIHFSLEADDLLDWRVREFDAWLLRSGCTPLSVELQDWWHRDVPKFLPSHCARWEFLKISDWALIPITDAPMPLLRHLDIATGTDDELVDIVFPEAPLLRSVILDDISALRLILPWVQLTSLQLNRVYRAECVPILQQTTNLVHCQLYLVVGGDTPGPDITLLRLESLILTDYGGGAYDGHYGYLQTFIVPSLRKLHIPERHLQTPIDSLTSFIATSGCKLQDVRILGRRWLTQEAYTAVFPSIQFSFAGSYVGKGLDVVSHTGAANISSAAE
ncbi:hypothetical protein C8R46DRAFT_1353803 [Mycena filopes]|nr:hypothetical protein C8R46DRAFT_1353803 [Mycena filopes]